MTALSYQNTIAVRIGGQEHRDWQSYDIDSDFLIPADGFDFELGVSSLQNEIPNMAGERCEVVINGETVLTGIIGSQRHDKSKGSRNLRLTGRDLACLLVDCSAPQLNVKGMTVLAAMRKLVEPWSKYIAKVALKAESNPTLDKIDIEPSETVWQAATHIANSVGLHIWLEADGTLIVGGADYSSPPVATLCWSRNDARRNIESLTIERSSDNRYSEVTFLAQSHGQLEGLTITISVGDHKTQSGKLWQAGQRVHLIDEEEGIDAIFFIMGRRFTLSRMGGTHTELRLKEDGVWTPDAYPKKAEQARKRTGRKKTAHGKNQNQELESK